MQQMVMANNFVASRGAGKKRRMFAEPVPVRLRIYSATNLGAIRVRRGTYLARLIATNARRKEVETSFTLEPGEYRLIVTTPNHNSAVFVELNGKPLAGYAGYASGAEKVIPFTISDEEATAAAPSAGAPRYLVKSPTEGGYYIESVRELGAREVARLRNQGFEVTSTTAAPSDPIRTRAGAAMRRAPALAGARQRRGIATAPVQKRRARKMVGPDIRHKSMPRRVFMEPSARDWVIMRKVTNGKLTIVIVRGSGVYNWLRAGYVIQERNPDTPAGQRKTWLWYDSGRAGGHIRWGTTSRPASRPTSQTAPKLSPTTPTPIPSAANAQLSDVQQRLATIDRNLVKLGQDASALGTSTGQRAQEIAQLRADYQADARDLHKKVSDLGRSGTDASDAIASLASQVAALDAKVAAAAGTSAGASAVGGFNFSSLTNLLPMVVIVMIIAMIAKVGR